MKSPACRFASCFLIVILAIGSPGRGLMSSGAAQDVHSAPELLLEARVLSIPFGALGPLGLSEPGSESSGSASARSFLLPLAEVEARSLVENPAAKTVHSMTLHATSGNRMQFRVDTRVPGNSSAGADTYFMVGIGVEATPTLRSNRVVSLMTGSMVQIRRGPPVKGVVPLLFETPLIRHEVQIADGMTILLGGFVAVSNVPAVPEMASVPGNPILNYVFSRGPKNPSDPEIVVLLTPRLTGTADPVVPLPSVPPPRPPTTTGPVTLPPSLPVAAVPVPAVTANAVIPDSAATAPPSTPVPPVFVAPEVAPAAFRLPARLSPPPAPAVTPKVVIRDSAATAPSTIPAPPVSVAPAMAPSALRLPSPLPPPPAPAVTPKVWIPASVVSDPPTKALPVPAAVGLGPSNSFAFPAPVSALPPPAVTPEAFIPASAAEAPPSTSDRDPSFPVLVTITPPARLEFPAPLSPLPPPPATTPVERDLPILVSAAAPPLTEWSLLSIARAGAVSPPHSNVPVPVSVSLAPAATWNLPSPEAPLPPPGEETPFHSVQVGAFRDRFRAEALAAELDERFGTAFIEIDAALRTPYRVRLGHLSNLAAARQLQRRLRSLGFDSFVVFPTA